MEEVYVETKVEALQDNQVAITVTVDAKDIDSRIKKAYKDFAHRYNFPGFRKGHAPRPVIDNAVGAETVRAQVTDEVINELYPLAIDAENLFPQGQPEFGEPELVENGKDYSFTATVAVKPELELSSYEPVSVTLPPEKATEREIELQIESLTEHYFTYENAPANTKVKAENAVELKMSATDDDGRAIESLASESRIYAMGSGLLPEAFDEEILGMKKGETKQFKIDNGSSTLTASLAGKTACITFDVEVVAVKKKVMPEITDDWVRDTLGFESVEELRERIVESIEEQKADLLPRLKENNCLMELADRLEGEVPEVMCEDNESQLLQSFFQQLQQRGTSFDAYLKAQNITSDQFKEDVKAQALDQAKQDLALDAWARHFELTATDEELSAEFVKSGAEDPAALEEEWRAAGRLHLIREGIVRTKAVDNVMETAVVTEYDPSEDEAEDGKAKGGKHAKKADDAEATEE